MKKKPSLIQLLTLLSEEQSLLPPNDRLTELIADADADGALTDDELEMVYAARKTEVKPVIPGRKET